MKRTLDDWLEHIGSVHPRSIEMGLDRVAEVARRLGVVQPAPKVAIVAGTNGKGSTCVALEALLLGAGHRVGTTLSPHVSRFNERVRIDGVELSDTRLCELFQAVDAARGEVLLTYFEYSALVALLAFRRAGVDVAVLEVGLGGRLDAFNLVDADLAVVTSIGLDHEDYLGADLQGIGREKAGVFRAGRPVVLGAVTDSVLREADRLGCPAWRLGQEFEVAQTADCWHYSSPPLGLEQRNLPRGVLAPSNCALALTAAALLDAGGVHDARRLAEVTLPGRMECLEFSGVPVLVDVAHNPAGAAFLAGELEERFPGRRFAAVLGMLEDKDAAGVAAALDGQVSQWLTVATLGVRAQSAVALAAKIGRPEAARNDLDGALAEALSAREPGGGILVFGSFSVVEQARALLAARSG